MNEHLIRAQLLVQQSRIDPAIDELRQAIVAEPGVARAHALLAICLTEKKEFETATNEAALAIQSDPTDWYSHFSMAHVYWRRNRLKEAREAIGEAIRLEPSEVTPWSVLAGVELQSRRWPQALKAAERGLELDPEDDGCTNFRSMALVKLGRQSEAGEAIGDALARNPQDAWTHANQGWTLLEKRKPREAMEHFREALRLDPEMDWARAGIVTAMKARNPFYRLILGYFLWMSKLSGRAQWGVILGLYFGYRIVGSVAKNNPELAPLLVPLIVLYILFALTTWLADPLFNLLLRTNRFGRFALSPDERRGSNFTGLCVLLSVGCVVAAVALGQVALLVAGACCLLMCMPVSTVFRCDPGWPRTAMAGYTALLASVGLLGTLGLAVGHGGGGSLISLFFIGLFLSPIAANVLASSTVRH